MTGDPKHSDQNGESLTEREKEVLRYLAHGGSNQELAAALKVEERTVRFHLEQISRKLGINHRGKLQAWAWANGFASETDSTQDNSDQ